ncbi:MAG: hypothetical protein ACT4QG_15890 [Sporichthyaceae bacterium]
MALTAALLSLTACTGPGVNPFAAPPAEQADVQTVAHTDLASSGRGSLTEASEPASSGPTMKVRIDTFADDVCSGFKVFGNSYQQARAERRERLYGPPAKAKRAMLDYVDDVDAALEKTVAATVAWGVPDVANGEKVARRIRAALVGAQEVNYRYRPQIAALQSDNRNFSGQARSLLAESEADLSAALLKLDWMDAGTEFRNAFNASRTCRAL